MTSKKKCCCVVEGECWYTALPCLCEGEEPPAETTIYPTCSTVDKSGGPPLTFIFADVCWHIPDATQLDTLPPGGVEVLAIEQVNPGATFPCNECCTRACCLEDFTCIEVPVQECLDQNGVPQPFLLCADVDCSCYRRATKCTIQSPSCDPNCPPDCAPLFLRTPCPPGPPETWPNFVFVDPVTGCCYFVTGGPVVNDDRIVVVFEGFLNCGTCSGEPPPGCGGFGICDHCPQILNMIISGFSLPTFGDSPNCHGFPGSNVQMWCGQNSSQSLVIPLNQGIGGGGEMTCLWQANLPPQPTIQVGCAGSCDVFISLARIRCDQGQGDTWEATLQTAIGFALPDDGIGCEFELAGLGTSHTWTQPIIDSNTPGGPPNCPLATGWTQIVGSSCSDGPLDLGLIVI